MRVYPNPESPRTSTVTRLVSRNTNVSETNGMLLAAKTIPETWSLSGASLSLVALFMAVFNSKLVSLESSAQRAIKKVVVVTR